MSTETLIESEVKPDLADVPPVWPPVSHLIHKKDRPAREGTIALCGAKLMGIDLGDFDITRDTCSKCVAIFAREYL